MIIEDINFIRNAAGTWGRTDGGRFYLKRRYDEALRAIDRLYEFAGNHPNSSLVSDAWDMADEFSAKLEAAWQLIVG